MCREVRSDSERRREQVASAWDREYQHDRYVGEPPIPFAADIVRAVYDEDLGGSLGLYVGCGNGRNLVPLVTAGVDLVGLDVSPSAIAQLSDRLPERRDRLILGTVEDLPLGMTFAVVVGIQVFQHGTRAEAHRHLKAAQERTAAGGLFCLRVNSAGTDVWPEHEVLEQASDGGFTVRYTTGPKSGLDVHFFSEEELRGLFAAEFEPVSPMKAVSHVRTSPQPGSWQQWEAIWRRRLTPGGSGRADS